MQASKNQLNACFVTMSVIEEEKTRKISANSVISAGEGEDGHSSRHSRAKKVQSHGSLAGILSLQIRIIRSREIKLQIWN